MSTPARVKAVALLGAWSTMLALATGLGWAMRHDLSVAGLLLLLAMATVCLIATAGLVIATVMSDAVDVTHDGEDVVGFASRFMRVEGCRLSPRWTSEHPQAAVDPRCAQPRMEAGQRYAVLDGGTLTQHRRVLTAIYDVGMLAATAGRMRWCRMERPRPGQVYCLPRRR